MSEGTETKVVVSKYVHRWCDGTRGNGDRGRRQGGRRQGGIKQKVHGNIGVWTNTEGKRHTMGEIHRVK